MEFKRLQRLAVLQSRFKPILDELDLKVKYVYRFGFKDIGFQNRNSSIVHSVRLDITKVVDGPVDDWNGVTMSYLNDREIPIGDNGWTHNYPDFGGNLETLGEDNEKNFAYIEKCLREYPLVRLGDTHPDMFEDPEIARIYRNLEDLIREYTTGPITFDRVDGVVGFSFVVDQTNETWRMACPYPQFAIEIDGKLHSETPKYGPEKDPKL
ncbi:MAG: hypothetical protein EOP06_23285, partial [Proteobacteria bacterium]